MVPTANLIIKMPLRLSVSDLESHIDRHLVHWHQGGPSDSSLGSRPREEPDVVAFDLRACEWIHPSALLYLISFVVRRKAARKTTNLLLPSSERARYFLEAWRFHDAFLAAVGESVASVCVGENRDFFEFAPHRENPYAGHWVDGPFGEDRLLPKYFFEISTFKRQFNLFDSSLALSESARWDRVGQVLRRSLAGPANLLASRIIFEALLNAVRHPAADTIQIVSFMQRSRAGGTFTVSVWDDGIPIGRTLKHAAQSGLSIAPPVDLQLRASYRRLLGHAFQKERRDGGIVRSTDIPDKSATEGDFLLASVFPGTTRDRRGHGPVPEALDDARSDVLAQPGMGLFLLANTAVAVYGGVVQLRAGDWNLKLSKPPHDEQPADDQDFGDTCDAELVDYPNWHPFNGNLVTVRLPLRAGAV